MRLTSRALALLTVLPLSLSVRAAAPPSAPAPTPDVSRPPIVVVVDMSKVIEGSKYAQMLQGRLKGLEDSIRRQLDPMQQAVEKKRTDFESNQASMAADVKERESQALADMERQLQIAGQQAQQAYNQQRDSLAFQMRQALEPVLDTLGKEKGWDLIVTRPGSDVIWSSQRLDVSALVIERLNAQPMPATPAAAPTQAPAPKPKP